MKLTQYTDFGLRALIALAVAPDRRHTVTGISQSYGISRNHLVKVVGHLSRVGWVRATRGRNGGLRLAADPQRLTVGQVLRELEGEDELVDCAGTNCALSLDCQLRGVLKAGMRAFYQELDRYTLSNMTEGGTGEQIVRMHKMFWSGTAAGAAA